MEKSSRYAGLVPDHLYKLIELIELLSNDSRFVIKAENERHHDHCIVVVIAIQQDKTFQGK